MVSGNGSKCSTDRVLPPGMTSRAARFASRLLGFCAAYRSRAAANAVSTERFAEICASLFTAHPLNSAGEHLCPCGKVRNFHVFLRVVTAVGIANQQHGRWDADSQFQ